MARSTVSTRRNGRRLLRTAVVLLVASATLSAPPSRAADAYAHVHHPISSSSPAAQAAFDRGLTLLYGFSRVAARRAFYQAAAADPQHAAIAYWGIAMTYGGNINVPPDVPNERLGSAAVRKALALSGSATAAERDYINALAPRFTTGAKPDYPALANAYHVAMRTLMRKHPDDLDAATLYAESGMNLRPWDLYTNDGSPQPGTKEICDTLETVLQADPTHIGANHFYVHATEASRHPERGLEAAGRLASRNFEPAASHLTHMPAHTLARTGYYKEASGSNVLATAHDRAYLAASGRNDAEAPLYYAHDLTFLAYTNGMDGNRPGAYSVVPKLQRAGFLVPATFVPLRFADWPAILALPRPKPYEFEPLRLLFWRYARGAAYASTGNVVAATRERSAMNDVAAKLNLPAIPGQTNSSQSLARLADDVLAANIAAAKGERTTAIAKLRAAVRDQDSLIYIEPPDWYFPVRESLGGALLRSGKAVEAASVFRTDLARNPRNPRSLFGLSKALAASGDRDGAERVNRQFNDAWKYATIALTVQSL